jgi:hypothetical protein
MVGASGSAPSHVAVDISRVSRFAHHGFERGSRIIAATDTSDLRGVMARGLYDIHLRPGLLLIEGP